MSKQLWSRLVATVQLASVMSMAGPTGAAQEGGQPRIDDALVEDGHITFTVRGLDAAPGSEGVTGQPQLRLDGRRVAATAELLTLPRAAAPPTAMLVIDSNGSMEGPRLDQVMAAAQAFLSAAPDDLRVGLAGFSDRPRLLAAPTTSRPTVRDAMQNLRAVGRTSLYDAVGLALSAVGGHRATPARRPQ